MPPSSSSASTLSSSGSSASAMMHLSSTTAAPTSPLAADELRRDCGYCANGKTLRDILPPKKCDYCFKFKCQFCTLRFPLIKVRKGLPKAMKGNSRICLHCFHQMWTDHAAAGALSSGAEMTPSTRRRDSLGRRESLSNNRVTSWGEDDDPTAYDAASLRESMLRDSFNASGGADASLAAIDEVAASPTPGSSNPPSAAKRVARALGLVIRTDTPKPQDVVHAVDLWLSLFAAATLLVVVLVDNLTLQQRVAFCVVIYGGFLAVHPWIHNVTVTSAPGRSPPALMRRRSSAAAAPSSYVTSRKSLTEPEPELAPQPVDIAPSTTVPVVFRPTLVKMQERFTRYLSDPTQWKLVKTTSGGKIYEIPNELPQALFMLDMFISGISISDFLSYMNRTDLKDRAVWDWNVGAFEIVEEYADDDTCIVYNAQKAFMGGFVSARDFCLLYKRSATTTIYASVEHPKVPERQGATRGIVHLAGLNCTPTKNAKGEDGFQLQYMVQVDIGGSIPTRLMYNGQVDNMDKMIKSFRQAHKLFTKRTTK